MKKISKLLIGTNNKGKYREIKDLLPKNIKTYSTTDYNLKSPKEDGLTFEENSIIKSKYFSKRTNLICLADDSGLEIDVLNKDDGLKIAHVDDKTPTPGDTFGLLEQVFSNLKRRQLDE